MSFSYDTAEFKLHKKWNFMLRICSVNVAKSVGNGVTEFVTAIL